MSFRLSVLLAAPLLAQDPLARRWDHVALHHDALRYDVTISLPDAGGVIDAAVTTLWRLTGTGPVVLDLGSELTVRRVSVNGAAARWRREGNRIVIPVRGRAGDTLTTAVEYNGAPRDGLVLRGVGAGRTVFADNWPDRARGWLASQDHPADKAAVAWSIEAPTGFRVLATGRFEGADTLGTGRVRWRFENPEPIPTYSMVVGMARLATTALPPAQCAVRCVPVSVVTYPADSAFAVDGPFRRASEMVAFFAERIAPFPYAELRHVESSTIFGGMENATAIFYDEKGYRERRTSEATVAHETAHQWWGDAVTEADWHHLWLSEGFATYGAALWAEHVGGDSALRAVMREERESLVRRPIIERPILDSTVTDRMQLLNPNNYNKGAWVLHSLRGLLGDSAFFAGLARYYRTFEHRNALSSDFARVMGGAARQDLGWYFRQALTQPGYPVLEVTTALEGGHLLVTVQQVQKKEWGWYRLPNLELRLDDRIVRVDVEGAVTRLATHWEGDRPPAVVEADPKGWWLVKDAKTERRKDGK
ncbi:MAG TPA: M1 family metallopeptidase [Gemmatimonadales bacterium]|jgi:aminopeptidase N|nr:M1 family metallopeptidase [Gemmatimonadales bacterium]